MSKAQEAETGRQILPALQKPVGKCTLRISHKSETQADHALWYKIKKEQLPILIRNFI